MNTILLVGTMYAYWLWVATIVQATQPVWFTVAKASKEDSK